MKRKLTAFRTQELQYYQQQNRDMAKEHHKDLEKIRAEFDERTKRHYEEYNKSLVSVQESMRTTRETLLTSIGRLTQLNTDAAEAMDLLQKQNTELQRELNEERELTAASADMVSKSRKRRRTAGDDDGDN